MNKLSIFEKTITKITNNNNYKRFEVLHDLATCEKGLKKGKNFLG